MLQCCNFMTEVSTSSPIVLIQLDRKNITFDNDIEISNYNGYMSLWQRFAKDAINCKNQFQKYEWKCEHHITYITIAYWYYIDKPHQHVPITIDLQ